VRLKRSTQDSPGCRLDIPIDSSHDAKFKMRNPRAQGVAAIGGRKPCSRCRDVEREGPDEAPAAFSRHGRCRREWSLDKIEYKLKREGGRIAKIDRWFSSSKRCACCGAIKKELNPSDWAWHCVACGKIHHRDDNAS